MLYNPQITAKGRKLFGPTSRDLKKMPDDILEDINNGVRSAALDIINELAIEGPNWDGEFRDNWVAIPIGGGSSGTVGGSYPYKLNNIPKLSISKKERGRVKKLEVVNISDYAPYALDLIPGRSNPFFALNNTPNKQPVDQGKRDTSRETFRGELTSEFGRGKSTAPLDWYVTYINGGAIGKNLKTGFNRGITFSN